MNDKTLAIREMQAESQAGMALAIAEEFLGFVPGANSLVQSIINLHKQQQLMRLEKFISASEIDYKYLADLANNGDKQTLFLEYIKKVVNTTSPLACVILGLIFKDDSIGDSLKSLAASALGDISQGTLNVFSDLMDFIEHSSMFREEFRNLLETSTPFFAQPPNRMGKEYIEIAAFSTDLTSRAICSKGSVIGDNGTSLGIYPFTVTIYSKLKEAKAILDATQRDH